MKRHIILGLHFLAQFLKTRMSYRADFIASLIANLVSTSLGLIFVVVVFSQVPSLAGWSFEQILFIYGFAQIPVGLFMLVSMNLWSFGSRYIIEGALDRILLRPMNPLFQVLCESFRIESLQEVLIGFALMVYALVKLDLSVGPLDIAFFIVLIASSSALLIGFFSCIASINFWVEDRMGIDAPFFNMLMLGRYPVSIYNSFLQLILSSVVPFAFVAFYPASYFLGSQEFQIQTLLTPIVAVFYVYLARFCWQRGLRGYGSVGN